MNKFSNIGVVLLAAGASTRLGSNKMKHVYKNQTLLQRAVKASQNSKVDKLVVVLGANQEENESQLTPLNVNFVFNKNWEKGIGSSIKCGLKNLLKNHPRPDAVIFSVCDQPYLSDKIFDALIEGYRNTGKKIITSAYNNTFGVPVLYDNSLFGDLLNIPDEHGAKRYIIEKANTEMVGSVPFPKGDIDIDTIDDLKKLTPP